MSSVPYTITIDNVMFQLQEAYSFDWLKSLGRVFTVFDRQDSGNIGFGVEKAGRKYFVKFAGCKPIDFEGDPQEAIDRLKQAIPLYHELSHPALIRLVSHFPVETGYAAVFEWFDGECLHAHWSFPPPAKYEHPDSPFYRYKRLPIEKRLTSLDAIFSFHVHVESKGYVAVDFYDGSILYDFSNYATRICDIDFYRKAPSVNDMGDFWGSKRFKSPEEFTYGAPIDARTNVFTMGAIAFGMLGGELDRSFSKWEAGQALYDVAMRAVRPDRPLRYASVAEFKAAWDAARPPPIWT
ncbi:serine/threonine protein kinase [Paenibacillus cisolokensis]|uniref:Serine/threonine protein kinase n=1 Tax=Paenibacillus cisolokensis TaxID=1658519 RepID=A0ABQ4NA35_9BACL|nr:serine/threonine-protein kinase [Paenibacillus cisolokensis]GIQ65093.1 serine/threonine protein kinase [Paenibacillus cisolokensis]